MPINVHGHRRLITDGRTVTPNHALLHVGRVRRQRVTFPETGGETTRHVRSICRGMGTAVHPDGSDVSIDPASNLPCDDITGDRIQFARDTKPKWTEHNVEGCP